MTLSDYSTPGESEKVGKQEFRRTDFCNRLLAAEGEGAGGSEGEGCA